MSSKQRDREFKKKFVKMWAALLAPLSPVAAVLAYVVSKIANRKIEEEEKNDNP